ncbi:MAG: energy transducer TonB [Bacteroidetes bacterium]|nr:energy transducer TonB [Bacteroidota bacterium]
MVHASREYRTGWIASICFHILLGITLYFSAVHQYVIEPQFVEMTWGSITSTELPIPEVPPTENSPRVSGQQEQQSDNSVTLPTRRFIDMSNEAISVQSKSKTITADAPTLQNTGKSAASEDRRSAYSSTGTGTKENALGKSPGTTDAQVATPFGSGADAGALGSTPSFSMVWAGGGNRKLTSGDMPVYPKGVNVEAQIKLRVVVLPNGTVRSVQPAQKGETRLENASIEKVRLWKFEPLLSAQPQVEQICTITFNFRLK